MKFYLSIFLFFLNSSLYSKDLFIKFDNNIENEGVYNLEKKYDDMIDSIINDNVENGLLIEVGNKSIHPIQAGYNITFENVKIILKKERILENIRIFNQIKEHKVFINKSIAKKTYDAYGYYMGSPGYCFTATLLDKNNNPLKKTKYYNPSKKPVSLYDMAPDYLSEDIKYFRKNRTDFNGYQNVTLAHYKSDVSFDLSSEELANMGGLSLKMIKSTVSNCHAFNLN